MKTIFNDCQVFIGDGRILESAGVMVENDRIIQVKKGELRDKDAETISLEGCTLLPGFIDCHVHLLMDMAFDTFGILLNTPDPMVMLKAAKFANDTLLAGITSVRDLGGKNGIDLLLRDAIKAGMVPGPRMQACGRMICMTGGTGWQLGREADGPDEIRKAVREELKSGVDVMKIMATGGILTAGTEPGSSQFTEEEMRAGIEEAHKAGRKTSTHAQGTEGIKNAVRAGIDSIEHGFYLDDEAVDLMKNRGVAFLPTLAIYKSGVRALAAGFPQPMIDEYLKMRPDHYQSVKMAHEAGITIGLGTDAGTAFNVHGENLVELKYLVEMGLSPMEALQAGTLTGAEILGVDESLGSIEEGKLADLVVVEGSPMDDVELLLDKDRFRIIMQGGNFVKKSGF